MKQIFLITLSLASSSAFSASEVPFAAYFGRYEVAQCKKIESTSDSSDLCLSKQVLIEKAPPCKGAPSNRIMFATAKQKFNTSCNYEANVLQPHEESFSPGDQLNPEFFKYAPDKDGSDHYYIRVTADGESYIFTDFWLKNSADGILVARFKRRVNPINSPDTIRSSFEYEFKLKTIK